MINSRLSFSRNLVVTENTYLRNSQAQQAPESYTQAKETMYSKEKITKIINDSLDKLFENDSQIIFKSYDLHERSITHRLAIYIEEHFKGTDYIVDVEYNRMRNAYGEDIIGNEIGKNLDLEAYGKKRSNVYPDIIVHQRDTNNNLLEIELKMQWKNSKRDFDYIKINEYMKQLEYQFGVYIELAETRENCLLEFGPFNIWPAP